MPENKRYVPIARPCLGAPEAEAASRAILSGWVTQGPEVAALEREFADYVGAEHACAVSNCTSALHLALIVCGVHPEHEVITVSHSFIATANSIRYTGATPVFVDIQPGTFNMDPGCIERAITDRTRAILCVHQVGMPCDLEAITAVGRRHSLPVIEDAACAIGSELLQGGEWQKIGRPHGDIACFSLHPRKVVSTGDGGMITTLNSDWDKRVRGLRQHSMSVPDTVRHGSKEVIFESYTELGYNYRLTDIQAAVGREQLKRLPEIIARRRFLAERYRSLLGSVSGLQLPEEPEWARSNWQSFCVRLPDHHDQRSVMQHLLDNGIASRRGVMCSHREPAYAKQPWSCGSGPGRCSCPESRCERLRESERATDQCILLPLFPDLSEEDQDLVAHTLQEACKQGERA